MKKSLQHMPFAGQMSNCLETLNQLIGQKVIPQELPDRGDNILWRRHFDASNLLPGDEGRSPSFSSEEKSRYVVALRLEIAELARTRRAACEEVILPYLPAPPGWEGCDAERSGEIHGAA
jgi:hypothetical protein